MGALWYCGRPEVRKALEELAVSGEAEDKKTASAVLKKTPVPFTRQQLNPVVLDQLWACFMATGEKRFVRRIMDALPWALPSKDQQNKGTAITDEQAESFLTGAAAKWSLTSNCHQHEKVMQFCQEERDANSTLRQVLSEVIAEASEQATHK